MSAILCFFHANCIDGTASAAIIKHKYPDAKLIPINHGDPLLVNVKGKTVFVVDYSFSEEIFKKMKKEAKEVFWYDHHKTAIPIQKALGWGILDLAESGASLTWKQEYPDASIPKVIQYVKDKDIWEWKLPHSREVSAALRETENIHDPSSESWKRWFADFKEVEIPKLIEWGSRALKTQKQRILEGAKRSFEVNFHGHKAMAVNWGLESSEMGEYFYKDLGYEIAIIFYYTGDVWNFSLRSDKIDVSELAKKYGGGGHPGASGFRTATIDWLFKLKLPRNKNNRKK